MITGTSSHIPSPLNGYQEPSTRQLTVSDMIGRYLGLAVTPPQPLPINMIVKFAWTSKSNLIEAPTLHLYPDPSTQYIVYHTMPADDDCAAQLSQEHHGQELPVALYLSHMIAQDTQQTNGALPNWKPI